MFTIVVLGSNVVENPRGLLKHRRPVLVLSAGVAEKGKNLFIFLPLKKARISSGVASLIVDGGSQPSARGAPAALQPRTQRRQWTAPSMRAP